MPSDERPAETVQAPRLPWIVAMVFLPFAGGYFLSYLYRTVNSVIGDDLVRDMTLTGSDIGLLTAVYLLAFGAFQIPLGVLLDRFGPRRVNGSLLCFAALGAFLFSVGESREALILGRALIGLGVSGCLMSSFKAITQWFPQERWPLANGCFLAVGGLGAIAATTPVQLALRVTDWRGVFLFLAIATIVVAALILLIVPDKREEKRFPSLMEQVRGLKDIYVSRLFWAIAPLTITTMAANLSIQGLWAGLWLRDVPGFGDDTKAFYLLLINVALMAGFIGSGVVADLAQRRGISLPAVMTGTVFLFMLAQAAIVFEVDVTGAWPWILFGLLANAAIFCYPILAGAFPLEYSGRANTAVNLIAFAGAFGAQYTIGGLIDLYPLSSNGRFVPAAYQTAFGVFLVLQLIGFLWFLFFFRRAR